MTRPLGISADRMAVWPGRPALDLWSLPNPEVTATLKALAQDMEAAAIDAGDQAPAGPERAFAAQRAIRADEIRESATKTPVSAESESDETDDIEEEENPW